MPKFVTLHIDNSDDEIRINADNIVMIEPRPNLKYTIAGLDSDRAGARRALIRQGKTKACEVEECVAEAARKASDLRTRHVASNRGTTMSEQAKDCEACFGTGNEPRTTQPGRKILFQPCPVCGGTGKVPVKAQAE